MNKYLNKVKSLVKKTGRKFSKARKKIKEVIKEGKGIILLNENTLKVSRILKYELFVDFYISLK